MVLIDSSVWIDYLGTHTSKVGQKLEFLIRPNNQAAITGVIFQEVLQGIRNPRSYDLTEKLMRRLPVLVPTLETHHLASELFKKLSSKGRALTTIDVLIAALAIENKMQLFTLDAGFREIEAHTALKLFA